MILLHDTEAAKIAYAWKKVFNGLNQAERKAKTPERNPRRDVIQARMDLEELGVLLRELLQERKGYLPSR